MKKNTGITIISLVVTIIILIILAGVSLNLTLGQNGIITKAKQAKENTELAKIEEETRLNELYMQMESEGINTGDTSYDAITKLVEFKREIASAISDMGVATAENADATTMASNIKSLSGNSSSDSEIRRYSYSWTSSNNEQKTLTLEVEPKYISFTVDGIRLNATLYDVENQEYIINTTGANIITSVNGKVVTINTWHDSTQVNYLCYW